MFTARTPRLYWLGPVGLVWCVWLLLSVSQEPAQDRWWVPAGLGILGFLFLGALADLALREAVFTREVIRYRTTTGRRFTKRYADVSGMSLDIERLELRFRDGGRLRIWSQDCDTEALALFVRENVEGQSTADGRGSS